ncbi:MAG: bifunctional nuclease family protein [Desulfobacteraceae bacterium]|jgi:bifunctional DNase/RNase|nr:bifunctional nuclease family protein [Desulfobacteraceae bacterium]
MLHKVNIAGLAMDPASNTPIIILKSIDEEHAIPIWIGLLEATSIASALKNVSYDRPMTHDLFKNFLDTLQIEVSKVEICDIRDNTYFAEIFFQTREDAFSMDARPSDAIAIALRFGAPLYVDDKVIQKSKSEDGEAEVFDESEEGKKWAEYLEKLPPDDFGKV